MDHVHKDEYVYKCELDYDIFKRSIRLPVDIKSEETKATLCNGVLKIISPKVAIISKTKIGIERIGRLSKNNYVIRK